MTITTSIVADIRLPSPNEPRPIEWMDETDSRVAHKFRHDIEKDREEDLGSVYALYRNGTIEPFPAGRVSGSRVMSKLDASDTQQAEAYLRSRTWESNAWTRDLFPGRPASPIAATQAHVVAASIKVHRGNSGDAFAYFAFRTEWGGVSTPSVWIDVRWLNQYRSWMNLMQGHVERVLPNARFASRCPHRVAPALDCAFVKKWSWKWAACSVCHDPTFRRKLREPASASTDSVAQPMRRALLMETTFISKSQPMLRDAMHRAFHGKCQMCYREVALAKEMEVDHILPASKTVTEIRLDLVAQGIEPVHADAFLARRWHGIHDCVLNYTVLCVDCNVKKSNNVLDIAALSLMLAYTAKQANEVVAYVNARSR